MIRSFRPFAGVTVDLLTCRAVRCKSVQFGWVYCLVSLSVSPPAVLQFVSIDVIRLPRREMLLWPCGFFRNQWQQNKQDSAQQRLFLFSVRHTLRARAHYVFFRLTQLRFSKFPWRRRKDGENAASNAIASTQRRRLRRRRWVCFFAFFVVWWPRPPFVDSSFQGNVRCRIILIVEKILWG